MKEMCRLVPQGACPTCGHKQFVVYENTTDLYLTNQDGEAIDHTEVRYIAFGKCLNCGKEFEMMPTSIGFIPLTGLRKILYEYSPSSYINETELGSTNNPMEVK